jgi:hypothetical protein
MHEAAAPFSKKTQQDDVLWATTRLFPRFEAEFISRNRKWIIF